jgi:ribonuclease T1
MRRWFVGFAALLMSSAALAFALPTVALHDLPPEAHQTLRLIDAGGPFPYRRDGIVFQNRERLLPAKSRGFYREYTVRTPGSRDRGARRLVTGGNPPEVVYYTADHYKSFRQIQR